MNKFNLSWKQAYGAFLLCAATAIALPAQTFTTLFSFDGTDGEGPYGALVQATDGNLYGTTEDGGGLDGYGTVFKISPSGMLTTYSLGDGSDGSNPTAELVQATDGNFYGTAYSGGASGLYDGAVFKMTPGGTLTALYSFCSQTDCTDGANPYAGVIQGTDGSFYGTTFGGGPNRNCVVSIGWGCGTVFKISPTGTFTSLYSFCSLSPCADGANPLAGLLQATDGSLYGTTEYGGGHCSGDGCGTIFEITLSGTLTTIHRFGFTDGANPTGALIQAGDGNFYGTTQHGGAYGEGTVFRISSDGTLTTLYNFCSLSSCLDGSIPAPGLIQATDGNFYGTTERGGAHRAGTVFSITLSGTRTTLHSFDGTDGAQSMAGLVQDTNGILYGTTFGGGANGEGTVFSLSVGLGPFVETQTTSGKIGSSVKILGTNLTGATSVTFNGIPAVFKVVSASLISATVPTGATTGKVQVVTPSGTLSSNVPFRVAP